MAAAEEPEEEDFVPPLWRSQRSGWKAATAAELAEEVEQEFASPPRRSTPGGREAATAAEFVEEAQEQYVVPPSQLTALGRRKAAAAEPGERTAPRRRKAAAAAQLEGDSASLPRRSAPGRRKAAAAAVQSEDASAPPPRESATGSRRSAASGDARKWPDERDAAAAAAPERDSAAPARDGVLGGRGPAAASVVPRALPAEQRHAAAASALSEEGCSEAEVYANICAWCGASRRLPFDLRSNFVCEDAGFQCRPAEASRAGLAVPRPCEEAEDGQEEELQELYESLCSWCGELRMLPFRLGPEFICRDVGLECSDTTAQRPEGKDSIIHNICAFCGRVRQLPFDFGEEFRCEDGGFDCDLSTNLAKQNAAHMAEELENNNTDEVTELFSHVCSRCGAERELPFDLRDSSFVCGDVGISCESAYGEQAYENFCVSCKMWKRCPFTMSEDFVCGDCDDVARRGRPRYVLAPLPPPPEEGSDSDDGLDVDTRAKHKQLTERIQLLWEVLIKEMSMEEAAELFKKKGHQPCTQEELMNLRTNTAKNHSRSSTDRNAMLKTRLKNLQKKGHTTRFRDNQSVSLGKKDKFLYSGGESAADKAATSVELYILGIGRGGRHAVKIARDGKKKGPRSHK